MEGIQYWPVLPLRFSASMSAFRVEVVILVRNRENKAQAVKEVMEFEPGTVTFFTGIQGIDIEGIGGQGEAADLGF